jgi:ligand-binding SRPBCC domain-containing protein
VEWEAVHFGIRQRLRTRITSMEKPTTFLDEQVFGAFASMRHHHLFVALGPTRTEKRDIMEVRAPLGPSGRLAEVLFLKAYMTAFLRRKNRELKALVEKGMAGGG